VTWLLRLWGLLRGVDPRSAALPAIIGLAIIGVVTGAVAVNQWLNTRDDAARAMAEAEAALATRDARIVALEAEIDARADAANVLRAHARRLERVAAERADLIRDLQSMEGADAPLSDYLRDAAGRLWRQPPPR
jgi:hypothetical protein